MSGTIVKAQIHPHVQMVKDYCQKHGVEKVQLAGGVEVYQFSNYMTVFGHKGKAYAISEMSSLDDKVAIGRIYDISNVKADDVSGLGASHGPSLETLEQSKMLTPDECSILWKDMGFTSGDVLNLVHRATSFSHGKGLREALEDVGLKLSKEEMRKAFDDADVYSPAARDKIVKEMYA